MSANLDEVISEPILLREDEDNIATLTLNSSKQYNALSRDMLTELQRALDDIAKDDSIRVVIIAASGKAFSPGHDLKEMRSSEDKAFHQALFNQCSKMMLTINHMPQPVIAQVGGVAAAAGCQLVANCDLAIASTEASFAVCGINLGLFCSTPAVPLSRNLSRKQAMHMLLTGDFISAQKAQTYGLINEVVEAEELNQAARDLARKIAARPPHAIQLGKKMFYQQLTMELPAAYSFANEMMASNMDSDDTREGIDAFLQKRKPEWDWL